MKHKIKLNKVIEQLKLTPIYMSNREDMIVDTSDLNRPGLQMSGFFEYFAANRVQLFGMAEITYMQDLPKEILSERVETYFNRPIPCCLIARNLTPPKEFMDAAIRHDVPVLMSGLTTTKLGHSMLMFLDNELAPFISRHGGLMDVFGIGVYITGESGVGKSETELELIKRGHRFVADDVVEIRRLADSRLVGRSPEVIRHLMEIRGIGLIDISVLYGMGTVMLEKDIDLCIHLEPGNVNHANRLSPNDQHITLLGVEVPKLTIPVRPGRNLAIIIEVAAMNHRLKSTGFSPTDKLNQRILELIG